MISNTINDDVTMAGGERTLLANRYRIIKQLGQGGMGSVWLAEDTELDDRQVAIKMLPSILLSNKRAYKQIKSEALVSLKLTHSNIATLRSFEENNGNPFLVIDYIDGRTLDDYLEERGALTEQETVSLLSPIAAALDYAHTKNIIHRDVKPGNVMIAGDGTPYILDFGIAREMQEVTTRVTGKLSSGTLMYMSPEQLHGAAPKAAQDVYSFATMVYECLAGAPPFSRGQIEYQIEHDAPAPLPEGFSIAKMVMSGLAKKPEDRPKTCSAILGLSGVEMTSRAIPLQPLAEKVAPSRAPSGRQDVADRLLQSAQAILEVDRMLAEVVKFEGFFRDPQMHSSRMAIKAAREEMESASGTRCIELLEGAKVIFAEAKSAYDDYVAKKRFIDEISKFISRTRGYRELSYESGVFACLREIEQLKVEVEKASAGAWQALQEKFQCVREKTEAEIRSALEKSREAAEKKQLEEEARRQQEELKKRQELEDQKRKEQAEIKSCKEKVDAVKQEIRSECEKVFAYVKAYPDYGDCLPIAKEIYASTSEEEPADLSGLCERLKKLEIDLERIRSLISNHDLVVCATLNGVEVGRASMVYGERKIDLPVRIKGRHRLTQDEGYLLEYARGNKKFCGWFSPAYAKSSEGQCAMVPLRSKPSISEISRAYFKKKPVRFAWDLLVALVLSLEVLVLVGYIAFGCFICCKVDEAISLVCGIVCGIVAAASWFFLSYFRLMRGEMRWAICGNDQYRMHQQSNFSESVLSLNRKERLRSEISKDFALHNWLKYSWRLFMALCFALNIGLLAGLFAGVVTQSREVGIVFGGLLAFPVACFFSCKRVVRREKWGALIGLDNYRARRVEPPIIKAGNETLVEEDRVRTGKSRGNLALLVVAICILIIGGPCCWLYWENVQAEKEQRLRQAKMQAEQKSKAEKARHNEEIRRKNAERARQLAEEKQKKEKAEEARIAEEKKKADAERIAAEKAEAERIAAEKAEAEAERKNREKELSEARDRAKAIETEIARDIEPELKRFNAWGCTSARNAYNEGARLRKSGNGAFADRDYATAEDRLAKAKEKLVDALRAAKKSCIDEHLAKARNWSSAGEWQLCEEECNTVLSLDAADEEARKLKDAAESHLAQQSKRREGTAQKLELVAAQPQKQRQVSLANRSSRQFADANTLSQLGPMSSLARAHYQKACDYAIKGASNKGKVKAEYDKGREYGGPEWPELEAWLDWWK